MTSLAIKKIDFLSGRVILIEISSSSSGMAIVTFKVEVSVGYDDGSVPSGHEISISFGDQIATGKTNGYGVAIVSISRLADRISGLSLEYASGSSTTVTACKFTTAIRIFARAMGYSKVVEISAPQITLKKGTSMSFDTNLTRLSV